MDFYNTSGDLRVRMVALYMEEGPLEWYRESVRTKGKPLSYVEFGKGLVSMYDYSKTHKAFDEIPQPLPLLIRRLGDKTPQSLKACARHHSDSSDNTLPFIQILNSVVDGEITAGSPPESTQLPMKGKETTASAIVQEQILERKFLSVEVGVGYDQLGQDITVAAMQACKDAISSNSVPTLTAATAATAATSMTPISSVTELYAQATRKVFDEMLEGGIAPLKDNLVLSEKTKPSPSLLEDIRSPIIALRLSSETKSVKQVPYNIPVVEIFAPNDEADRMLDIGFELQLNIGNIDELDWLGKIEKLNSSIYVFRTAIKVYLEYMKSVRTEFNVFFHEGIISEIPKMYRDVDPDVSS